MLPYISTEKVADALGNFFHLEQIGRSRHAQGTASRDDDEVARFGQSDTLRKCRAHGKQFLDRRRRCELEHLHAPTELQPAAYFLACGNGQDGYSGATF